MVGEGQHDWPEGFFATEHLSTHDLQLLRKSFEDWSSQLRSARRSKQVPPF